MTSTADGERTLAALVTTGSAEDPYPAYALLRERASVCPLPPRSLWVVTRYEECRAVLRDSERFPAWTGLAPFAAQSPDPAATVRVPANDARDDPTPRLRRRQFAYHALAPRARSISLEPELRGIARRMVETIPSGPCDLVSELAAPFAEAVLGAYFGLPQTAWHDYLDRWVRELRPADGKPRAVTGPVTEMIRAANLRRARTAFEAAVQAELDSRRRCPRGDVLTAMAQAAASDDGYEDADTLRIVPTLANNALLGLTDLIGTVIWQLLANPWLAANVADDEAALSWAIEEILRLEPPVHGVQRRAAIPVALGGAHIPAGAAVLVLLASANRDADRFPDPDRLDPRRPNAADHLSFGHGVDFCIGAPLVRRATVILTGAFLNRIAGFRLLDGDAIRHWPNPFNRGLQRLRVIVDG